MPAVKRSREIKWKPVVLDPLLQLELQGEGVTFIEEFDDGSQKDIILASRPGEVKKQRKAQIEKDVVSSERSQKKVSKNSKWLLALPDIPQELITALEAHNFVEPTPIQDRLLSAVYGGTVDVAGAAETGSGKTLAFGIPLVARLLRQRNSAAEPLAGPSVLIIVPSRELALQVTRHIGRIVPPNTFLKVQNVIGGLSPEKQQRLLDRDHPQIVVGTPGRLNQFLQGTSSYLSSLSKLQAIVLDEADRLTEEGHFRDLTSLLRLVRRSLGAKAKNLQTLVFSATMSHVAKRWKRANKHSTVSPLEAFFSRVRPAEAANRPIHIVDLTTQNDTEEKRSSASQQDPHQTKVAVNLQFPKSLEVKVIGCLEKEKELQLFIFLDQKLTKSEKTKILVFVNSISYVYRLEPLMKLLLDKTSLLNQTAKSTANLPKATLKDKPLSEGNFLLAQTASKPSEAASASKKGDAKTAVVVLGLHSKLKQSQRLKKLERFTKTPKALLFCTDVAARGLDLPEVDVVVHLQPPREASIFVHRSGRTARAGAAGCTVCMCGDRDSVIWNRIFNSVDLSLKHFALLDGAGAAEIERLSSKQQSLYKDRYEVARTIDEISLKLRKRNQERTLSAQLSKGLDVEDQDPPSSDEREVALLTKKLKSQQKILQKLQAIQLSS